MMITKHKIEFENLISDRLKFYRNGVLELEIIGASEWLKDELLKIIVVEKDYEVFCEGWGLEDCHLKSYLINLIAVSGEIASEFAKVLVK